MRGAQHGKFYFYFMGTVPDSCCYLRHISHCVDFLLLDDASHHSKTLPKMASQEKLEESKYDTKSQQVLRLDAETWIIQVVSDRYRAILVVPHLSDYLRHLFG